VVNKGLFVVMGVAGSGKSLIGAALARALDLEFVEGDDFHSVENVKRMSTGVPLTDDDRADWLSALAFRLHVTRNAGMGVVIACSALKRAYRDVLRGGTGAEDVRFIYLKGSPGLIAQRLAKRGGHFMPASMLESQFATLEEPSPDEDVWVFDISKSPEVIVADLVARASK
jgi:gluconokinase